MNGFIELTQEEMMMVDAGGWFSIFCGVFAATVAAAIVITSTGNIVAGVAAAAAGYELGSAIGEDIEAI